MRRALPMTRSIQEAKNVIAGAPFGAGADSPLWADAKTKIKTLVDGGKIDGGRGEGAARTAARDGADRQA